MPTKSEQKNEKSREGRTPIVTILGHVDHGKTTILDKIRESNVQKCEAGGITQKVSVFTVDVDGKGNLITFIDTPGHEAFDLMRVRGESVADIVLLVVAADDGVKPQTKESIDIINNSSAKPIVVINKCDLPNINLEKVKRDIVNNGMQLEGFGGSVPVIEVSGKTGKGIPELLDLISLVAEVEGLKEGSNLPKGVLGKVFVLESVKDKFKGNVSSVVLTEGRMCKGNWFGYMLNGRIFLEKIKGIVTEDGTNMCLLSRGCGGRVIGLSNLLELGTEGYVLENKDTKLLESLLKKDNTDSGVEDIDIEDFFSIRADNDEKSLSVIVKSSSEGSLEAILNSLKRIKEDDFSVKIVSSGVGNISLSDVEFALVTKSIVLGFEVSVEQGVDDFAKKNGVLVKTYDVIYRLTEEVQEALAIMSLPQESEEEIGSAVVRAVFTLSDGTKIIGCKVESGILKKDCKVYVVRKDEILVESKIKSLRINKDSVSEVKSGIECGMQITSTVDVMEGDKVFCYKKI